jgi:hypothetical protein
MTKPRPAIAMLCVTLLSAACHRRVAWISLFIETEDHADVPCSLSLSPVRPATGWSLEPPTAIRSRGLRHWSINMGAVETWPTEFDATLTCEGYRPWKSRVISESSVNPSISIDAKIKKL